MAFLSKHGAEWTALGLSDSQTLQQTQDHLLVSIPRACTVWRIPDAKDKMPGKWQLTEQGSLMVKEQEPRAYWAAGFPRWPTGGKHFLATASYHCGSNGFFSGVTGHSTPCFCLCILSWIRTTTKLCEKRPGASPTSQGWVVKAAESEPILADPTGIFSSS